MNILWICNGALPEASELLKEKPSPFGGWFVSISSLLCNIEGIKLSIAFPKSGISEIKRLNGKLLTYYAFKPVSEKELKKPIINQQIKTIIDEVKPDIINVFGTEFPHCLAVLRCSDAQKTAIHIQGLTSIYAKHYFASLPENILKRYAFRDLIKNNSIIKQMEYFEKRGLFEIEALKLAKHVIGRTTWDYACTKQINPDLNYHFCNETLRDEFYKHQWSINKCEKHSIFLSQAGYPIKGFHYILEAMPMILKRFSDAKVYVSGGDITKSATFKDKLKMSSYGKYIKELIHKFNLHDKVIFLGTLDEKQMCERHLKSHVFVCPSSIENSPNSLGEAMILGVPCVASDVGGVTDLLVNKEEGFVYQHDATYMLAHYVCEIFENNNLAQKFSKNAREHALKTHNREENINTLLNIYNKICTE